MYVRAAWKDASNAPTRMEDGVELQRFCTPSLITIDQGGALLGYPAQMAAWGGGARPLLWRYSRGGLNDSTFVARDAAGRGLTASAFTALTARRLVKECGAWFHSPPDVVLVVPDKLGPAARLGLSTLVADATQRPVQVCGEDQALLAGLKMPQTGGTGLVVSVDDDALRLRVIDLAGSATPGRASRTVPGLGMQALRDAWLSQWSRDFGELIPGVSLFECSDSADFEKMWQDVWQCLDSDPRLNARMPAWTVVRGSTVIPLVFPRPVAEAAIGVFARDVVARVGQLLADADCRAQSLAAVAVVAPIGLGRILAKALTKEIGVKDAMVRVADPGVYAQGAATRRLDVVEPGFQILAAAPFKLGALGASKDDKGLVLKPLIEAGAPLPAHASFSIVANRDVQRRLVIKLAQQQADGQPELCHLAEFGPLHGQGMLRVKVNVVWEPDGRIGATAVDAETEIPLPLLDASDVVPAGPVIGSAHIRLLD
jgi:hypothetical protein